VKPFSQACENNAQPIFSVLQRVFANTTRVLEIGSGTGQHSVYFAPRLPHLSWQTSDLPVNHGGINAWIDDCPAPNLLRPMALDVTQADWPSAAFDGIFTANTCHIMPWSAVETLFARLPDVLATDPVLALYGPFKYGGEFTTESNARFDQWLKQQAHHQGVRDIEAIIALAENSGLQLLEDNPMPANNQLLVFGAQ
jgi:cyclopropane fatty-acyl-phospholipid synthase-like methyltransferase